MSNAFRTIKDSEVDTCKRNGMEPVEQRVDTDAIAVEVNPENDFLTNVTRTGNDLLGPEREECLRYTCTRRR